MAASRDRVIQVQKKAQSLDQFQKGLGEGGSSPALKGLLIGLGMAAALGLGYGAYAVHRQGGIDKHAAALAALRVEVEGAPGSPADPAQLEQRMRAALPRLEALAQSAPASERAETQGLLASWKLSLDGKGGLAANDADAWGRLRDAKRLVALGQAKASRDLLAPLRAKADASQPWSEAYWQAVLETDRLAADRAQGYRDLAEYKERFKDQGASQQLEQMVKSM